MEKKKGLQSPYTIGSAVIGSAIIWGATLIGCAIRLKGTECYSQISHILALGAGAHLILIWAPLSAQLIKLFKQKKD